MREGLDHIWGAHLRDLEILRYDLAHRRVKSGGGPITAFTTGRGAYGRIADARYRRLLDGLAEPVLTRLLGGGGRTGPRRFELLGTHPWRAADVRDAGSRPLPHEPNPYFLDLELLRTLRDRDRELIVDGRGERGVELLAELARRDVLDPKTPADRAAALALRDVIPQRVTKWYERDPKPTAETLAQAPDNPIAYLSPEALRRADDPAVSEVVAGAVTKSVRDRIRTLGGWVGVGPGAAQAPAALPQPTYWITPRWETALERFDRIAHANRPAGIEADAWDAARPEDRVAEYLGRRLADVTPKQQAAAAHPSVALLAKLEQRSAERDVLRERDDVANALEDEIAELRETALAAEQRVEKASRLTRGKLRRRADAALRELRAGVEATAAARIEADAVHTRLERRDAIDAAVRREAEVRRSRRLTAERALLERRYEWALMHSLARIHRTVADAETVLAWAKGERRSTRVRLTTSPWQLRRASSGRTGRAWLRAVRRQAAAAAQRRQALLDDVGAGLLPAVALHARSRWTPTAAAVKAARAPMHEARVAWELMVSEANLLLEQTQALSAALRQAPPGDRMMLRLQAVDVRRQAEALAPPRSVVLDRLQAVRDAEAEVSRLRLSRGEALVDVRLTVPHTWIRGDDAGGPGRAPRAEAAAAGGDGRDGRDGRDPVVLLAAALLAASGAGAAGLIGHAGRLAGARPSGMGALVVPATPQHAAKPDRMRASGVPPPPADPRTTIADLPLPHVRPFADPSEQPTVRDDAWAKLPNAQREQLLLGTMRHAERQRRGKSLSSAWIGDADMPGGPVHRDPLNDAQEAQLGTWVKSASSPLDSTVTVHRDGDAVHDLFFPPGSQVVVTEVDVSVRPVHTTPWDLIDGLMAWGLRHEDHPAPVLATTRSAVDLIGNTGMGRSIGDYARGYLFTSGPTRGERESALRALVEELIDAHVRVAGVDRANAGLLGLASLGQPVRAVSQARTAPIAAALARRGVAPELSPEQLAHGVVAYLDGTLSGPAAVNRVNELAWQLGSPVAGLSRDELERFSAAFSYGYQRRWWRAPAFLDALRALHASGRDRTLALSERATGVLLYGLDGAADAEGRRRSLRGAPRHAVAARAAHARRSARRRAGPCVAGARRVLAAPEPPRRDAAGGAALARRLP